jgi:hypothetical protein
MTNYGIYQRPQKHPLMSSQQANPVSKHKPQNSSQQANPVSKHKHHNSSQQENSVANSVANFANSGESSAPIVRWFSAKSFYLCCILSHN